MRLLTLFSVICRNFTLLYKVMYTCTYISSCKCVLLLLKLHMSEFGHWFAFSLFSTEPATFTVLRNTQ